MTLAKARTAASRMNGYEHEFEKLFLMARPHGFEQITLRLGDDCRYTPDFWVLENDGTITFKEVKGHWRDDAKVKIRVAAEMYPMFRFEAWAKINKVWTRQHFGQEDAA